MAEPNGACEGKAVAAALETDAVQIHPCAENDARENDGGLAASVGKRGVARPLLVCLNGGAYYVIDGTARLEAARAAQLEEVPAYVLLDVSDDEAPVLRALGNAFEADLPPSRQGRVITQARSCLSAIIARNPSFYGTHRPPVRRFLASIADRSVSVIYLYASIDADIIDEFKDMIDAGLVSDLGARALSLKSKDAQRALAAYMRERGVSEKAAVRRILRSFDSPGESLASIERTLAETVGVLGVLNTALTQDEIAALQHIVGTATGALAQAGTLGR